MEVPWRTHDWLSSHARAGCISLNVENAEVLDGSHIVGENIEVPRSEEKSLFLYGVVMQQCSGHVDEDVDTISGGECHGSHIDKCYRDFVGTSMCL
ncbi:unnamed protein product [Prunus armeniaca]